MERKLNFIEIELSREPIELVAKYGPFLTPLAPASYAVAGMIISMWPSMTWMSILPAFGSGIGMEATGYLSSHLLIRAIRRGDFWSGLLSLVFLIGYAVFAVVAMSNMQSAEMFQAFVAMSVVTYLCAGLYTFDNKQEAEKVRALEMRRKQMEIEREETEIKRAEWEHLERMEKLQTSKAQADARKAKAEHANGFVRANTNTRTSEQNSRALGSDKIAEIREYQKANPDKTVREVAAACGVSVGSVAKYGKMVTQ